MTNKPHIVGYVPLREILQQVVSNYDSVNQAARAMRIDQAYLHRLLSGELSQPSQYTLDRLGLERIVLYREKP